MPNAVDDIDARVAYYTAILQKQAQESDAIWSRFGILSGITLAIFGGYGYVILRSTPNTGLAYSLIVGGLLVSLWSYLTLVDIWKWHNHWVCVLKDIESSFPPPEAGWRRAFDKAPCSRLDGVTGAVDGATGAVWWASTQLIMLLYALGWLGLFVWQTWIRVVEVA